MRYCVYIHKLPNNKVYVGATCQKPNYRWDNGRGYRYNKNLYNDILKYGWNNIEHIVVCNNLSREEAREKEKELISFFNANNSKYGYNKSKGGEIKKEITLETRLKTSRSLAGKYKRTKYIHKIRERENKPGKAVICIETQKVFPRIIDASEYYEICDETIRLCCHKKRFTAGGYHWEFYKEVDL